MGKCLLLKSIQFLIVIIIFSAGTINVRKRECQPVSCKLSAIMATTDRQSHHRGDRLKQLRAFCQAARLGSISQAAELIQSSQPAVSLQVRTLEEELGTLLFERRGPRISLTRVGENLYKLAMPLVEGMDRLPNTFAEKHHGVVADVLRIGAGQTSASHLLPRFIEQFREQYPETRIEIRSGTGRQRLSVGFAPFSWTRRAAMDSRDRRRVPSEFTRCPVPSRAATTSGRRQSVSIEGRAYPFVGHAAKQYVRRSRK